MSRTILVVGRCDSILQKFCSQTAINYILLENPETFDDIVRENSPDLIVLDNALGLRRDCEICRIIRKKTFAPVIILTNYHDERDELTALDSGCTAYFSKTVDYRLFQARLAAFLKTTATQSDKPVAATEKPMAVISLGALAVNTEAGDVLMAEKRVELTVMEYKILELLVKNIGRTFNRQQIIDNTQGLSFEGFERTIDSHIKNLRKKLSEYAPRESYIKTVYGLGYKISEPTVLS